MANQEHRIVTEMEVDGVIYREERTLTPYTCTFDGKEKQEIVFTRSIGDKSWSERKIISTENEETYLSETSMTWEEVQAFEEDWNKNWNPVDIPTPRVFSTSLNNSWMSTFGMALALIRDSLLSLALTFSQLFGWAALVLVLVLVILLFLGLFTILDMYRSNMWI